MSDGLIIPVSDQMLKDIGRATVHWTYLEFLLDLVLWKLLNITPEEGFVVTARLDSRPKCEMLKIIAYTRALAPEAISDLNITLKAIADASADRNLLTHAVICREEGSREVHLLTLRGRNAGKKNPITDDSITTMAQRIIDARSSLYQWAITYGYLTPSSDEPYPFPDKNP
ncbi:hypothetical protein VH569_11275 [Azospirillum sp. 11R-A]|uniref:hypothetical protein n=1 Tax=Azospirillum sp. 11R-A TaxID=3111634 RepID=UPI003C1326AD